MRALAVLLLAAGCASPEARLVSRFAASATYHTAAYEHRCQGTGGHFPAECKPCQATVNEAAWQAPVAKTNRDIGYLPPSEIADIERLIAELEKCP